MFRRIFGIQNILYVLQFYYAYNVVEAQGDEISQAEQRLLQHFATLSRFLFLCLQHSTLKGLRFVTCDCSYVNG